MHHAEAWERLPELVGLHPVDGAEAALRAHVGECRACRPRLAELERIAEALCGVEPVGAPSSELERRVLAIPAEHLQAPPPRRRRRWAAAVAALLLAVAGVVGGLMLTGRGGEAPSFDPVRAVALAGPGAGVRATVELGRPDGGRQPIRLTVQGLGAGGGRYYRVWLRGPAGEVALEPFRPDKAGRCVVLLEAPLEHYRSVTITRGDTPPGPAATIAAGKL